MKLKAGFITYCNSCGRVYDGNIDFCKGCSQEITTKPLSVLISANINSYLGGHPRYYDRQSPFTLVITPELLVGITQLAGVNKYKIGLWVPLDNIEEVYSDTADASGRGAAAATGFLLAGIGGAIVGGALPSGRIYLRMNAKELNSTSYGLLFELGMKDKATQVKAMQLTDAIKHSIQERNKSLPSDDMKE